MTTTTTEAAGVAAGSRRRRNGSVPSAIAAPPAPPVLNIKCMLVTPEQANEWLRSNAEDNRHQRIKKIESFARDMKAGKWQITGDTIKITPEGILIDGQHRLKAVVLAGVPVYMVVAFDVPHSAMAVVDTGTARTFADNLRGIEIPHRNETAAIVRRIAVWDQGNRMGKGGQNPTHAELLDRFNAEPEPYVTAAARGVDTSRAKVAAAASAGTAFYLFARIDPEWSHRYFDGLISGANLGRNHPILTVRNRLMRTGRDEKLIPVEQLAVLIRAWNAFRGDRTLEKIQVTRKGDLTNRNFPLPV
jgi:hypothetical protein